MILEYLQMVVGLTNLNDPLKKWRILSKKFVKLKCFSGFTCRVGTKFISGNYMSWRTFQSTKWRSVYMRIVTFMVTVHFWRDVIQMYWWRSRHSNFLFCKIFREINFDVILTEFFGILPKSSLPNTWVATLAVAGGPGSRLELSILWSLNFSLSSCSRIEKLCSLSVNSWYSCQSYKKVLKIDEFFSSIQFLTFLPSRK